VGTGFDGRTLLALRRKLDAITSDRPAFANPPRGAEARGVHWVEPRLVAEIAFTEWTNEGTLRHPSFRGLREDKSARDVVRESPAAMKSGSASPETRGSGSRSRRRAASADHDNVVAGVALSNATKLLYPDAGLTKGDVARYYEMIADRLLPHVRNRPLSLVRCPEGWKRKCFYQKHATDAVSGALERVTVQENGGPALYMMANTTAALVTLAQMGVLELHPWGSTARKLTAPDRLIFDLDPDDKLPWGEVADAARHVRALLDEIGLACFLKTTGGKGLHVVVPIRPTLHWDGVKAFSRGVADLLVRAFPDRFTAQMAKARRSGRIFIDYLRNADGATAIAPYSLRARAGAPVAMPIGWNELRADVRLDHFNLRSVPARLKRLKADPWGDFFASERTLTRAMMKRIGIAPP
jgi:bifunctional non-homologous end joining protein LigD